MRYEHKYNTSVSWFCCSIVSYLKHLVVVEEADHGERAVAHHVRRGRAPQGSGHGYQIETGERLGKAVSLQIFPNTHRLQIEKEQKQEAKNNIKNVTRIIIMLHHRESCAIFKRNVGYSGGKLTCCVRTRILHTTKFTLPSVGVDITMYLRCASNLTVSCLYVLYVCLDGVEQTLIYVVPMPVAPVV